MRPVDPKSLTVEILMENPVLELARARNPANSYTEVPPLVQDLGDSLLAVISTGWSVGALVEPGEAILTSTSPFQSNAAALIGSDIVSGNQLKWMTPPDRLDPATFWRRNYYGIYGMTILPGEGGVRLFGVLHGENKNEIISGIRYDNTVRGPGQSYEDSDYSGVVHGIYQDNYDNYFGFIGMASSPLDPGALDFQSSDYGPILWPSAGYLSSRGIKKSSGLRHPSLLVHDGYVYVYYLETSNDIELGREPGYKVARAPVGSSFDPLAFRKYYGGRFEEPGLPEGFDKDDRSFLQVKGGRSSSIIDTHAVRFYVARIKDTPYFLGVEERQSQTMGIYLRVSTDLVNWSEGTFVPGTEAPNWYDGYLHYPILMNKSQDSVTEIDASDFFIVGTYNKVPGHQVAGPGVQYIRLSVRIRDKES